MVLKEGQKAPNFELRDAKGDKVRLSDFLGKKIALYFYPKDDTPGCTMQAKQFTSSKGDLERLNAVVLGVSLDDENSHKKFCSKYGINYGLLCDTKAEVSKKYGVYGPKQFMGKKSMGIIRSTFVIDEQGMIIKAFYRVNPEKSISEVLEALKE